MFRLRQILSAYLIISLFGAYNLFSQENNKQEIANEVIINPFKTGKWAKIQISKSGVYKLDYTQLVDAFSKIGLNVGSVDAKNVAIYGNRGGMLPTLNSSYVDNVLLELPIEFKGESDSKIDNGDYILFYAEGPESWEYNYSTSIANYKNNIYSDYTYVFLTVKDSQAKRITTESNSNLPTTKVSEKFNDFQIHHQELINVLETGQDWFGENLFLQSEYNFDFEFPARDISTDINLDVKIVNAPESSSNVDLNLNSLNILTFNLNATIDYYASNRRISVQNQNENLNFLIKANSQQGPGCYLDYIQVNTTCNLRGVDNQFDFRDFSNFNSNNVVEYRISNPSKLSEVWKVNDLFSTSKMTLSDNSTYKSFKIESNKVDEFVFLPVAGDFYSVGEISALDNQDLHSISNVDYLIISHESLLSEAERLADFHRASGLSVEVVDVDKIYNEFSAGRLDATAIRQFVRRVNLNSTPGKLKYLLLFGDGSYDYKDRIENNNNLIPTYQSSFSLSKSSSFVTDDYYAVLDDNEGADVFGFDKVDLAVGRITAIDLEDAKNIIDKIVNYSSSSNTGDWKTKIQFVADNVAKASWEAVLMEDSERLSDTVSATNSSFNHEKVYIDIFELERSSGFSYSPGAHTKFMENLQYGNLITNYFGHGNELAITGEGLFEFEDISKLVNGSRLPLFITVTCEYSRFDNPEIYTGGEKLLSHDKGGAIALISTTREMTVNFGSILNTKILESLLPRKIEDRVSIGTALMKVKNMFPGYQTRRAVSLLGDPALFLSYPKKELVFSNEDYSLISEQDTLKSLQKVKLIGQVLDNSFVDVDYSGKAIVEVYDKKAYLESLDQNNFGIKIPYWLQNNLVHKGEYSVENGEFAVEFIVPKDINYSIGDAKVFAYVYNENEDAFGDNSQVQIGGISDSYQIDSEGPQIQLFLNDNVFVDGGVSNSNPILKAELEDYSGINTVGNGIGHDLVLTIEKDSGEKWEYKVNNFYKSNLDDFTKGKLEYQLYSLEDGNYTASLVAWDVYNNSNKSELNFKVVNDSINNLFKVDNYPNPFKDQTVFRIANNQAQGELEFHIDIFDINGKIVNSLVNKFDSSSFVDLSIPWDGTSFSKEKLPAGVYIYKVYFVDENQKISNTNSNKLIISQ